MGISTSTDVSFPLSGSPATVQRGMAFTNLSASASKAGCTLRTTLGFWISPVSSDTVNFTTTLPSMPCSRASCG